MNLVTVLTPYNAQVTLFKKQLALYSDDPANFNVSTVRVKTVDTMHAEKSSVVFLSMVNTEDLGFMEEPQRLCVAFSRARDALIVFHNATSISMNLNRRSLRVYQDIVEYLQTHDAFKYYSKEISGVFMERDEDAILQREQDDYATRKYYQGLKAVLDEENVPATSSKGKQKLVEAINSRPSSPLHATANAAMVPGWAFEPPDRATSPHAPGHAPANTNWSAGAADAPVTSSAAPDAQDNANWEGY
ncbi:hypothetical protein MMC18_007884 [Xylographa bjoerkii]|nr:hypothetical protein [Xylographa bjoerkii]